ncbi:undecaprenyl-diphosphatase [Roseburia hominis A2-183]|uniref:Undecaprenyl-diphosphatase n=2 Tax=Roseburia hominis TaxID=301301 RepID=G2T1B2_ROSHA|nr:undecaprenyl-diphosphatase [Roseburia hominis A2-183]
MAWQRLMHSSYEKNGVFMAEILKAIIFGIVEGITEWLPISSTGHMILLNEFLTLDVSAEFWDMFLVVIQLGAILAVVVLFWNLIWPFARSSSEAVVAAEQNEKSGSLAKREYWVLGPVTVRMPVIINWCKIVVSCLPAIVFVVLGLDETCDRLFYNPVCVAVALIVFGVAFILVENHNAAKQAPVEQMRDITFQMAILIGLFQLLAAAFPGTSRSGATIIGALLIGVSRKAASEFTFILAIPVMLGASLLKLMDFGLHLTGTEWAVLLSGMVSAFLVSVVVIKFLLGYIRKHDFKVFGWYRIGLGVVVLLYFFLLK